MLQGCHCRLCVCAMTPVRCHLQDPFEAGRDLGCVMTDACARATVDELRRGQRLLTACSRPPTAGEEGLLEALCQPRRR